MNRNSGQALLEFAICFPVALAAVAATVLLFKTEWNRTQCAHQAFLAAHRALRAEDGVAPRVRSILSQTEVEKTESGVKVTAYCGGAVETVRLPDLEHARW